MKNLMMPAVMLGFIGFQSASFASERIGVSQAGLIEVELSQATDYSGETTGDIVLATVELGFKAEINSEITAELVLLYEEDDTPLDVDAALITFQPAGSDWAITAGQMYLPFGTFGTNLVSDPLTLELGEIRESALQVDVIKGGLSTSVYLFNGDDKTNKTSEDRLDNFGFKVNYQYESRHENKLKISTSLSYLNDLANTDAMQEVLAAGVSDQYVSAYAFDIAVESGRLFFMLEYIAANDAFETSEFDFNGNAAKPSASNIELGYSMELAGKPAIMSIAHQTTAEALALELPEARTMLALSIDIYADTILSFEMSNDKDYSVANGGSGKTANTFTAQMLVAF